MTNFLNVDVEVTPARIGDVPGMLALLNQYSQRGEILPRSPEDLYQSLREWAVARQDGKIVGCGSLVILWSDLAEVRSLVVSPEKQGQGIGRRLVDLLLIQATDLEIPQVFALTRKLEFFLSLGFHRVSRDTLPRKIWKDCIHCTKFMGCDEVAVVRAVGEEPAQDTEYRIPMSAMAPVP